MLNLLEVHQICWTCPSDHAIQTHTSHSYINVKPFGNILRGSDLHEHYVITTRRSQTASFPQSRCRTYYTCSLPSATYHAFFSALVQMLDKHTMERCSWIYQRFLQLAAQTPMQFSISSVSDIKHRQITALSLLDIHMFLFILAFFLDRGKAMMKRYTWCNITIPHPCMYILFLSIHLGIVCPILRYSLSYKWKESFHSFFIVDLDYFFLGVY